MLITGRGREPHPARIAAATAAPLPLARLPSCLPLPCASQPNNDIDSFVRVVDGQFVVGPTCKRFLVTGWNQ